MLSSCKTGSPPLGSGVSLATVTKWASERIPSGTEACITVSDHETTGASANVGNEKFEGRGAI
ncbi:MAG: hypothetical protein AAFY88_09940, partial [Acidobacteriota bacterium]